MYVPVTKNSDDRIHPVIDDNSPDSGRDDTYGSRTDAVFTIKSLI